jgi:hypothetical protein
LQVNAASGHAEARLGGKLAALGEHCEAALQDKADRDACVSPLVLQSVIAEMQQRLADSSQVRCRLITDAACADGPAWAGLLKVIIAAAMVTCSQFRSHAAPITSCPRQESPRPHPQCPDASRAAPQVSLKVAPCARHRDEIGCTARAGSASGPSRGERGVGRADAAGAPIGWRRQSHRGA